MVWMVDLPRSSAVSTEQSKASPFYQTFSAFLHGIGLPQSHWEEVLSRLDYSQIDRSWRMVASLTGARPDTPDKPWGFVSSHRLSAHLPPAEIS